MDPDPYAGRRWGAARDHTSGSPPNRGAGGAMAKGAARQVDNQRAFAAVAGK